MATQPPNHTDTTDKPVKKNHNGGVLTAFLVRPHGIRFETQAEKEEIILFLRQHFIVNLQWVMFVVILAIVPIFLFPLITAFGFWPQNIPWGYYLVVPALWYLGLAGYGFASYMHWYFNIYIVSSDRIVDIDWINLLYKHFASTELTNIQDVSYKQTGIFGTFFDYGDVYIQTAGTEQNFEFTSVPKPNEVVGQINALLKKVP